MCAPSEAEPDAPSEQGGEAVAPVRKTQKIGGVQKEKISKGIETEVGDVEQVKVSEESESWRAGEAEQTQESTETESQGKGDSSAKDKAKSDADN